MPGSFCQSPKTNAWILPGVSCGNARGPVSVLRQSPRQAISRRWRPGPAASTAARSLRNCYPGSRLPKALKRHCSGYTGHAATLFGACRTVETVVTGTPCPAAVLRQEIIYVARCPGRGRSGTGPVPRSRNRPKALINLRTCTRKTFGWVPAFLRDAPFPPRQ